jgi:hypothetical protein
MGSGGMRASHALRNEMIHCAIAPRNLKALLQLLKNPGLYVADGKWHCRLE